MMKKSNLKDRIESEGLGTFEKHEGMEPEYSEEFVDKNNIKKSEEQDITIKKDYTQWL